MTMHFLVAFSLHNQHPLAVWASPHCRLSTDALQSRCKHALGALMFWRMISVVAAGLLLIQPAEAHRVALVVGQNAYVGGGAATLGLVPLANPGRDARRMAELLVQHGFEVIACDGKTPGCFDLD